MTFQTETPKSFDKSNPTVSGRSWDWKEKRWRRRMRCWMKTLKRCIPTKWGGHTAGMGIYWGIRWGLKIIWMFWKNPYSTQVGHRKLSRHIAEDDEEMIKMKEYMEQKGLWWEVHISVRKNHCHILHFILNRGAVSIWSWHGFSFPSDLFSRNFPITLALFRTFKESVYVFKGCITQPYQFTSRYPGVETEFTDQSRSFTSRQI